MDSRISNCTKPGPMLPAPPKISGGLPYQLSRLRSYKRLGKGCFGTVFQVNDPSDNKDYALKCIRMWDKHNKTMDQLVSEVHILMKLEHLNIVHIIGAWPTEIVDEHAYLYLTSAISDKATCPNRNRSRTCTCTISYPKSNDQKFIAEITKRRSSLPTYEESRDLLCIKMELCDKKTLQDLIKSKGNTIIRFVGEFGNWRVNVREIKRIFAQLLSVLEYLKMSGIIHNDIKPDNILFKNGILKLADFGLATIQTRNKVPVPNGCHDIIAADSDDPISFPKAQDYGNMKPISNTNEYRNPYKSPELRGNKRHFGVTYKSDMYSVGCVIFRLLSNSRRLISSLPNCEKVVTILNRLEEVYPVELELIRVLTRMIALSPVDRPDTTDAQLIQFKDKVSCDPAHPNVCNNGTTNLIMETRRDWNARPPRAEFIPMQLPVSCVIIIHSVYGEGHCDTDENCQNLMKEIQNLHMDDNGWDDIAYQFVVGGNGHIYECRGWDKAGAHSYEYNKDSIGICLLGDFRLHLPPPVQLGATQRLIQFGVENGKISRDYRLYGHCDLRPTESPGEYLYKAICKWDHKATPPVVN